MSSRSVRAASSVRLALFALCAAAVLLVAGCARQFAPPLVEVTEIAPREIEAGDRLEVHGKGFPQGRSGRLTLEGTIHRPGESPARVTVDAEGTVATPDRLEISVREVFVEQLCGRGDRAAHATFRGDVEVAFASNNPGAPPLVGTLRDVVLDVMPASTRASVVDARIAEGGRVLSFVGVVPGAPTPRGLPVEQVRSGSLASAAGIQTGDVLVSVDGVNVLSLGDVLPASARGVDFSVRHADSESEETRTLSLIEYSGERVPAEFAPALLVVGLALAVLLLLVLPGPPSLAALELRIASVMRRTTWRALLGDLFGTGRHAALSAILSAVIAAFALSPYVVAREVDGALMLAVAVTGLVWSRVALERGALASLWTLLRMGLAALAIVGASAITIGQVGAVELAEIVRSQGIAPWELAAARTPSCAVAATVYGVAIIEVLRTRPTSASAQSKPPPHAALLERAGVVVASALGVTMFLGGWQIVGLNEARGHGLVLVAAALFVVKTWCVVAFLLGTSRIVTARRPREMQIVFLKRLLPGLVLAGALVAASRRLVPGTHVETALGATTAALVLLFSLRMTARVRVAMGRPEPYASPFL